MHRIAVAAVFTLLLLAVPVVAFDAHPVQLSRAGGIPIALTEESLSRLPTLEQDVSFQTSNGIRSARYKGVLLWDVLKANGVLDEADRHGELRQVFSVIGADGYRIDFSVGEIAPDFGNKAVMLAREADGKPLAPPRLVVPGDRLGARSVRDVVRIEVR